MISIYLYGELRKYAPHRSPNGDSRLQLISIEDDTLEKVLRRARLDIDEIYTIFLNAKLLATHNSMAPWLAYQQVNQNCHNWDLSVSIKDGDRIALFGRDMPALVV
jgi:hypothetical protein